jgi:DNA polymerase-3 subunit gamma/tau
MSSQSLYRKYRPQKFEDVLGQKDTIAILKRAISENSISHAYLFSGGRGTGKTTVARIFAAGIGCAPSDLYEIDAASNRSIDDIRDLRQAVQTMPFESPYKVYIIDEVHMLTKEAFNALLKTLEEPPLHVVFILATTDREKLPETIISRCQSFVFREPTKDELAKYVIETARSEKFTIDHAAADIIALFGDGSYRDTLSVLEKVLMSSEGKVLDVDHVARIVGAPTHDLVNDVLRAIEANDHSIGLTAIRRAHEEEVNMQIYLRLILEKIRAVLLLRYDKNTMKLFAEEYGDDDMKFIMSLASSPTRKINSHVLGTFLSATRDIGYAFIDTLPIELALLRAIGEEKNSSPS